jgi:adenylate kinase
MLAERGLGLDRVVELTVDTDVVVARLVRRALELGRVDDTEEVIRHRQELFAQQTAPLTAVYEAQGLLRRVDGLGAVDEVTARILAALDL